MISLHLSSPENGQVLNGRYKQNNRKAGLVFSLLNQKLGLPLGDRHWQGNLASTAGKISRIVTGRKLGGCWMPKLPAECYTLVAPHTQNLSRLNDKKEPEPQELGSFWSVATGALDLSFNLAWSILFPVMCLMTRKKAQTIKELCPIKLPATLVLALSSLSPLVFSGSRSIKAFFSN